MMSTDSAVVQQTNDSASTGSRRSLKMIVLLRGLQLSSLGLGVSLIVWAFFDHRFRNEEGILGGKFCLAVASGFALITLGCALASRFKVLAFWFALALVGQAVSLQMIEAGNQIRYQHYLPLSRLLTSSQAGLTLFFLAQSVIVAVAIKKQLPKIRAWLTHTFKIWQLLCIGLLCLLSSAAVSRDFRAYAFELPFAFFVQVVNLATIVMVVLAIPNDLLAILKEKYQRLLGRSGDEQQIEVGRIDRFVLLASVWVLILTAGLSYYTYENHPHVPDEVIYIYHARCLANGDLTVPAPPVPEAFSIYMVPYKSERWYSPLPPAWPAVLAIGFLFGVPWLVNPLLASLSVLLSYILLQQLYSRRTARMAVLLLCISPWYLFMGMNFMNHTFTLICALAGAVAIARARSTANWIWALGGGMAVGIVSLIRPLDGLLVAALLGLWALGIGGRRLKTLSIGAFVLGIGITGALVLPYNKAITGNPVSSPLTAYYDQYFGPGVFALGFGSNRGLGWQLDAFPGHSPLEALVNASLNFFSINIELFGWSTGSLVLVGLLVFSGRLQRSDYLMIAVIFASVGLYSLFWYSGGPDFGARYWYLTIIPFVALTVRSLEWLEQRFKGEATKDQSRSIKLLSAVALLSLLTLINYIPWRAIDKYHHYLGMRPDIQKLAREYDFGKSLVLIRGDSHPDYASAWVFNPLDPYADSPIYAWDRDLQLRAQILEAYRDRQVWLVDGPTITRGGYKVVQGPLSINDLIEKDVGEPKAAN
jgi:4-amino-4-deoxy-L-arabinose transferase-like glycosyltransferase